MEVESRPIAETNNIESMDLKHADSDSVNSIPPPPPPMGVVVPVASEESVDITEAERIRQTQEVDHHYHQGEPVDGHEEEHELREQHHHMHYQETTQTQTLQEKEPIQNGGDGGSDNCCEKTLRCLSLVPCGSLLSWVVLMVGIGCLVGGLLIGVSRSRDLLDDQDLLWFMEYTLIGVAVGLFVVCTLFLVVGHLSSHPTSRRVFNSRRKNQCGKGLNVFVMVLCYILAAIWILMTVLLGTPLVFILNFIIVDRDTFNPGIYGFKSKDYSGDELDDFSEKTENLLVCYGVALFGSFLIANSLIFFIMSISANIKHLQDSRFATLNAYDGEEVGNSKHSVVDTNM